MRTPIDRNVSVPKLELATLDGLTTGKTIKPNKEEGARSPIKQDPHARLMIAVILRGALDEDVEYFRSDVFAEHFNAIPDKWVSYILGKNDSVTAKEAAEIIIANINKGYYAQLGNVLNSGIYS